MVSPTPHGQPPAKKSLLRAFAKAAAKVVIGVVLALTLAYGGYLTATYAGKGTPLTANETVMVESVFGDEIDASRIRKHYRDNTGATFLGRIAKTVDGMVPPPLSHIDFFGTDVHSEDFGADSARLADLFMHEVTHVWQNQNMRWSLHHLDKVRTYSYTLTDSSKFSHFAVEQQASIIGQYTRVFLHPQGRYRTGKEMSADDIRLRDVVENRFARAKETRESVTITPAKPATAKPRMPNS